jgi:hypothetical protein
MPPLNIHIAACIDYYGKEVEEKVIYSILNDLIWLLGGIKYKKAHDLKTIRKVHNSGKVQTDPWVTELMYHHVLLDQVSETESNFNAYKIMLIDDLKATGLRILPKLDDVADFVLDISLGFAFGFDEQIELIERSKQYIDQSLEHYLAQGYDKRKIRGISDKIKSFNPHDMCTTDGLVSIYNKHFRSKHKVEA